MRVALINPRFRLPIDTRTTAQVTLVATRSIEECNASEISASEPMAMPTTSFASARLPLARTEIAATEDFLPLSLVRAVMGGGLAVHRPTSSGHPQALVTNPQKFACCELF